LEVKVGTYVAKDGTYGKPGWTEYSGISVAMVTSFLDGVVELNCPVGHLSWWADEDLKDLYTMLKNDDTSSDSPTWLASAMFTWTEIGVHTVLSKGPDKQLLKSQRKKMQKLVKKGGRLFGEYWNFTMYVFVEHMWCIIVCTPTVTICLDMGVVVKG
jgi:hypothetical protein